MRRLIVGLASIFLPLCMSIEAVAGVWTQPTDEFDWFDSRGDKWFQLLPAWTGAPVPIPLHFTGYGPTHIVRDSLDDAFLQGGRDTINTEIVSLDLIGTAGGFNVQLKAGRNNGVYADLDHTRGQIQDTAASPVDGKIDFPAESIFDVFFDLWVDLDNDMTPDLGEVVSNDFRNVEGAALRMQQLTLIDVPPPVGTFYDAWDIIPADDPAIGTFWANQLPLPLELRPIDLNRNAIDTAHVLVTAAVHTVVPEPSALAIWSVVGVFGMGIRRRPRKRPAAV